MSKPVDCVYCDDTGVLETGNNDFPCSCPAGATAKFNVCGYDRPMTGAELRADGHDDSHANAVARKRAADRLKKEGVDE